MNFDVSPAWAKIQGILSGAAFMLPNVVLALVLFTISCLLARWAKGLIVEALGGVDGVLKEPGPSAVCTGIAANGVCVGARWWTDSKHGDEVAVTDRAIPAIKNRLFENGIEIAYPTHQVLFHDQTEEVDGDRRRQRAGWPAGRGDVPRQRRLGDVLSRLVETAAGRNGNGDGSASDSGAESRG